MKTSASFIVFFLWRVHMVGWARELGLVGVQVVFGRWYDDSEVTGVCCRVGVSRFSVLIFVRLCD